MLPTFVNNTGRFVTEDLNALLIFGSIAIWSVVVTHHGLLHDEVSDATVAKVVHLTVRQFLVIVTRK